MKSTTLLKALLFATAVCTAAHADIMYQWSDASNNGNVVASFQYTAPDFLNSPNNVPIFVAAANLASCMAPGTASCEGVDFYPLSTSFTSSGIPYAVVGFKYSSPGGPLYEYYYYFPNGSMGADGVYPESLDLFPGEKATLTVSGTPSVPEPGAIYLLGTVIALVAIKVGRNRMPARHQS